MKLTREQIVEDLANSDFLVFAGTGISKPTEVDTWPQLMDRFNAVLFEITSQELAGIEVNTVEGLVYPEVAQMFYVKFNDLGMPEKYTEIIKEAVIPKATTDTGTQLDLIAESKDNCIITTNYDATFENAYKRLTEYEQLNENMSFQTLGSLVQDIGSCRITYLHGRYDSDEIILKTSDYEKYYSEYTECKELYDFLKYIYKSHTIVFVGFSFADRYLLRAIRNINDEIIERSGSSIAAIKPVKHFALLPALKEIDSSDVNPLRKDEIQSRNVKNSEARENLVSSLGRFGIETHEYAENCHTEIGLIMQEIKKKRKSGEIMESDHE